MDPNRYVGRRVRVKVDVPIGQKIACYLTEEQVVSGPEGVVTRATAEEEGLVFEVDLENVPSDYRFPADACILIDSEPAR
jgi:hypothetical protein